MHVICGKTKRKTRILFCQEEQKIATVADLLGLLVIVFSVGEVPGRSKNSISADGLTTNIFGDKKCDLFLGYNLFA